MLDNDLIKLIISTLIAGESGRGIAGTPIAQAFQPTAQGTNTKPTAFLTKISDHRYGFPLRQDVYDSVNEIMVHTEIQVYESMFQLSTLAAQNPTTPQIYTASDIANLCASILQSDAAMVLFQAQDVGIERVTDVRNPYFEDDHQRYEASPSFDFVMIHKQIIGGTVPVLVTEEFGIYSI